MNRPTTAPPRDRRKARAGLTAAVAAAAMAYGWIGGPLPSDRTWSGWARSAWAQAEPKRSADPKALKKIERTIRLRRSRSTRLDWRSRALMREIAKLRENLVRTAGFAQQYERELSALEAELNALLAKERRRRLAFARRQNQLARILATLQRISLYPPESLIAMSGRPNDTVRGTLMMRALVPQLERRATALRGELREMAALRQTIEQRRTQLKAANTALATRRKEIANLLERQSGLLRATVEERRALKAQVADLGTKAKTLRDLVARLGAERRERAKKNPQEPDKSTRTAALTRPSALRRFSLARGKLTLPVAGRITRSYGQETADGLISKGMELISRVGAQVVAPYDGQVVFAGPFRGYGRILIIKHSEGYHTLIAGLTRIDVSVNQWVLASEPIGAMGESRNTTPRLYLELRHRGRPINPLPWMAADKSKAKG